ncbi:hypothetical protein CEP52_017574 [Fusarium oligoseptatum]|uniref:Uncharacterized protein n=1 Tax=Fusarium oligoseptatum TaxID=2604345 RepID=A0A428RNA3_9HYPO|nr:hypothetical protein CEP52_017574 [Fusarium oligoseptatum]
MTPPLLPASAAPFAPRASSRIRQEERRRYNQEEQRRQKRVKKRLLNNVLQHQRYLTEILSSPNAIWTLASIMLPKTPEADFEREAHNPLVEAVMKYETIQIEGYVVCVDMALRNEVTYKLTNDTIGTLIEHHKEIYHVEVAHTWGWPDGKQWHKDLHEEFVRTINEFVFCTHVSALEGLKEDGTGKVINEKK